MSAPARHHAEACSPLAALAFAVLFGGTVAVEIVGLLFHESGTPMTQRGDRPRVVGEIADGVSVVQTFTVDAGGFSGVTIAGRPYHESVSGDVVFTLQEVSPDGQGENSDVSGSLRHIARLVRPADEVVAAAAFRFDFPPIEHSKGRHYRLQIQAPNTPAGRGLGLWATRDQTYRGGLLIVGGREQWGDLVFKAHATLATPFARLEYALRDQPVWLRSRLTLTAIILAYNVALGVFAWYMLMTRRHDRVGEAG